MYPHNYPEEISRQFPVSLPYYNTSSDHSLAPSSTYGGGAMSDHSKYSRGGTSDGTTPVTSQQQQHQQPQGGGQQGSGSGLQQGQHLPAHFMNYPYPFYSHMYHMPHGGFSAPHNVRDGICVELLEFVCVVWREKVSTFKCICSSNSSSSGIIVVVHYPIHRHII